MNREERQKLVLELYEQGKTIREIAQIAHMSFGNICSLIKQKENNNKGILSKNTQAFQLFESGKKPVEVSIKLDLEAEQVAKLYRQYWDLRGVHELNTIYEEINKEIFTFLELYKTARRAGMGIQQVVDVLKSVDELPFLESQRDKLKNDIQKLAYQKQNLFDDLNELTDNIAYAKKVLVSDERNIDFKKQEIAKLNNQKHEIERIIANLKSNREYLHVQRIDEDYY
ncbi:MAG: hypothetical protein M3Y53_06035 [Thermoproteota archaeon]|nr:hypothetical protein [Thermoproteota archaeon]